MERGEAERVRSRERESIRINERERHKEQEKAIKKDRKCGNVMNL